MTYIIYTSMIMIPVCAKLVIITLIGLLCDLLITPIKVLPPYGQCGGIEAGLTCLRVNFPYCGTKFLV